MDLVTQSSVPWYLMMEKEGFIEGLLTPRDAAK